MNFEYNLKYSKLLVEKKKISLKKIGNSCKFTEKQWKNCKIYGQFLRNR